MKSIIFCSFSQLFSIVFYKQVINRENGDEMGYKYEGQTFTVR